MRLTSPTEVRSLLERMAFKPSRILGQNFLIDGNILDILLGLAELKPDDQVLEIGPGLGVLTGPLLERVARVVAIEKDDVLHEHLVGTLGDRANFTLLHQDALQVDLAGLLAGGINKVVANLPYSVGSRLLIELALAPQRPACMVVTRTRSLDHSIGHQAAAHCRSLFSSRLCVSGSTSHGSRRSPPTNQSTLPTSRRFSTAANSGGEPFSAPTGACPRR